ncbi:uncharacterized protein [Aristolochia californica]|uniref:uncharacterized protein n=1 Tax=Aristolochia californica TaxID=171875 RepID=UPI0035E129E4
MPTSQPITNFVSHHHLSPICCQFLLVISSVPVCLLLSLAANSSWQVYQLDAKKWSEWDIKEDIYMQQPPGYVVDGESSLSTGRTKYSFSCFSRMTTISSKINISLYKNHTENWLNSSKLFFNLTFAASIIDFSL